EICLRFCSAVLGLTHYFRVARNPSGIDAKRADHFLQADLNEAARAADATREANGAVYGDRLK
ncbi:MAG TPA: hypothetical protein VIX19_09665, partial [Terriglobales bacterium]